MSHSFLIALLFLAPLPAATIDLPGTADRVRRANPPLQAARLAIDEARGRLLGAGQLANPTVSFEFQGESGLSPQAAGGAIDQAFPITQRLRLEKHLSSQMLAAAQWEVRDHERILIAEAQSLVIKVLVLEQQRFLRERQAVLAKELADFARERSGQGEISPLDAAQALVDAQRALLGARTLQTQRISVLGDLKRALGLPATEELTVNGQLPPLSFSTESGPEQRPDFQGALLKVEAARTGVALAKARKWEDVTAGIFAAKETQAVTGGRDHTGFAGFRISLPLPLWNQNEGEIVEKTASAQRAALETEALAAQIGNEAAAARNEMAAYAPLAAELRDTLLPAIREQTTRLEHAYKRGETDLLSVLRAREQHLEIEAAALDSAEDFHLARVRHEAAIGTHVPSSSGTPPKSFP